MHACTIYSELIEKINLNGFLFSYSFKVFNKLLITNGAKFQNLVCFFHIIKPSKLTKRILIELALSILCFVDLRGFIATNHLI